MPFRARAKTSTCQSRSSSRYAVHTATLSVRMTLTYLRCVDVMSDLHLRGRDCPRRRAHAAVELSGASAGRFLRPGARSATLDSENGVVGLIGQASSSSVFPL